MKKIFNLIQTRITAVLTAGLLVTALSANAQEAPENYVAYPYAFVGIQGGAQTTFTDYNNWKLITPTASISAGVQFTPVIGARLHFNGIWNKGGIWVGNNDARYKYRYLTSNLDLMVNMTNLFSKEDYHPLNLYLIGGVGLNYAWHNGEAYAMRQYMPTAYKNNRLSHNFRAGIMADYKVTRNVSVNLEVSANSLNDRYNSKYSTCDDWQLTAQLGLAYKFGIRHKVRDRQTSMVVETPDNISEQVTNAVDKNVDTSKPEEKTVQKPVVEPVAPKAQEVKDESITRNIYFEIRSSDVTSVEMSKLAEVAQWLKDHPKAKVTVTGYADSGTGNPTINARYAKQRADAVTKLLTKKYQIAPSRIITSSKGDTVQPFSQNDKNRVAIVIGKE